MLDIAKHEQVMTRILLGLVSQKTLAPILGFKGGTALYLFEKLDRFSTDLDFDLIGEGSEEEKRLIEQVVRSQVKIVDKKTKRFTWYWQGSYERGASRLKVEVNTRQYPNEYEIRNYRGYSVRVLEKEYVFAHKLCAVLDRKSLQNRDLYDVWWMMKHDYPVNKQIVKQRMGRSLSSYWGEVLQLVRSLPKNYDVLQGLGEVMTQAKKDWVKAKLLQELELELASRVGINCNV